MNTALSDARKKGPPWLGDIRLRARELEQAFPQLRHTPQM